jgi:hypothetical protein
MRKNVGAADRVVRVIVGLALLSVLFLARGNARYLGLIGLIPLVTALVGWCPAWTLLGVNTCPVKSGKAA